MPFPLQHALSAGKSSRQTKGDVRESGFAFVVQVHPGTGTVRQGEQMSVETFVRYWNPEVIVPTDSKLEPAAMLCSDFNGCFNLL